MNILLSSAAKDYSGKASTISGWGGTKANSVDNPVVQPNQCALKEGIVEVRYRMEAGGWRLEDKR